MLVSASKIFREYVEPADQRFGGATLVWCAVTPLLHRVRRGEGQLLAVNASVALWYLSDLGTLLLQILISAAVLALLYLLNDVFDARRDLNDPAKYQTFVAFCVTHRTRLFGVLAVGHVAVFLLAWLLLGPRSAAAVAAVSIVNLLYSSFIKGMVAIDIPFVALWGGLFVLVPGLGLPIALVAMVGVMTSICHVFQITRDTDVDRLNRVRTSSVTSRWFPEVELVLLCVAMAAILWSVLGPVAAVTAAVPLVLRHSLPNQTAWLLSKAYYGLIWLVVLGRLYEG